MTTKEKAEPLTLAVLNIARALRTLDAINGQANELHTYSTAHRAGIGDAIRQEVELARVLLTNASETLERLREDSSAAGVGEALERASAQVAEARREMAGLRDDTLQAFDRIEKEVRQAHREVDAGGEHLAAVGVSSSALALARERLGKLADDLTRLLAQGSAARGAGEPAPAGGGGAPLEDAAQLLGRIERAKAELQRVCTNFEEERAKCKTAAEVGRLVVRAAMAHGFHLRVLAILDGLTVPQFEGGPQS